MRSLNQAVFTANRLRALGRVMVEGLMVVRSTKIEVFTIGDMTIGTKIGIRGPC
jgi:hypothetical protein